MWKPGELPQRKTALFTQTVLYHPDEAHKQVTDATEILQQRVNEALQAHGEQGWQTMAVEFSTALGERGVVLSTIVLFEKQGV